VAFKNLGTGEVMEGGTFHPDLSNKLPTGHTGWDDATEATQFFHGTPEKHWEAGFVTKDGNFLSRRAATKYVPKNQRRFLGALVDSDDVFNMVPQGD